VALPKVKSCMVSVLQMVRRTLDERLPVECQRSTESTPALQQTHLKKPAAQTHQAPLEPYPMDNTHRGVVDGAREPTKEEGWGDPFWPMSINGETMSVFAETSLLKPYQKWRPWVQLIHP